MTAQNSTYKECNISVDVTGPDDSGAYSGTFVITREVGDADDDRQFTPAWRTAVFSEAEALSRLTRLAKDVIDGEADGSEI
jgi:hypothetical protein